MVYYLAMSCTDELTVVKSSRSFTFICVLIFYVVATGLLCSSMLTMVSFCNCIPCIGINKAKNLFVNG